MLTEMFNLGGGFHGSLCKRIFLYEHSLSASSRDEP